MMNDKNAPVLLCNHLRWVREYLAPSSEGDPVFGASATMNALLVQARMIAHDNARPVIIHGEDGTGKLLIAKLIHQNDPLRRDNPFVVVNCSGLDDAALDIELFGQRPLDPKPGGALERARGGTLVLRGIVPPGTRQRVMTAVIDKVICRSSKADVPLDVRVIVTSVHDPVPAVDPTKVTASCWSTLRTPPLRERMEDVLPLIDYFIDRYNRIYNKSIRGLSHEATMMVLSYDWVGNVAELDNAIHRAVMLDAGPLLVPESLSDAVPHTPVTPDVIVDRDDAVLDVADDAINKRLVFLLSKILGSYSIEDVERCMVSLALRQRFGNKTKAARLLGITRDALRSRVEKFGLEVRSRTTP